MIWTEQLCYCTEGFRCMKQPVCFRVLHRTMLEFSGSPFHGYGKHFSTTSALTSFCFNKRKSWKGCLDVSFVRKGSDLIFRFPFLLLWGDFASKEVQKSQVARFPTIPYLYTTVDGRNPANQLRLVAYIPLLYIIIKVLYKRDGCLGYGWTHSPKAAVFVATSSQVVAASVEVWNEVHLNVLGAVLGPWGHPLCHRSWVGSR